ncbi:MAG: right-handed parallel beta-helix repeat-containing protein [Candidatus Thermoplasmatota archaeon]|nr:right-handed parallel beta-helix repeat-containing protein [Candidatus Thermoplasmatota archaeon]MBU1941858.1 right-handed parallel beta-helix repeat-containing protein [Candidatus Thermoplasmatota archaeon]
MSRNSKYYNIRRILFTLYFIYCISGIVIGQQSSNLIDFSHSIQMNNPQGLLGTYLFVDDDNIIGPWDGTLEHPYQYIQDAINNADVHDHIYIFNGTYYEHLHISKPLTLEGESVESTIVNGNYIGTVIYLPSHNSTLARITLQNSGITLLDSGIHIIGEHNIIMECKIRHNTYGINITSSGNAIIYSNFLENTHNAHISTNATIMYNYWEDHLKTDQNEDGICDTPYNLSGGNQQDKTPLVHYYGYIQNIDTREIFFNIQGAIDAINTQPGHTIQLSPDIYHEHLLIQKSIIIQSCTNQASIIHGQMLGTVITIEADNVIINTCQIVYSGKNLTDAGIRIVGSYAQITHSDINNNRIGIHLQNTTNTLIIANEIQNNTWNGIYITGTSHFNTITKNIIKSNVFAGIGILTTVNNYIYHNDLIDNHINAFDEGYNLWDNSYPSGGNYWDDYNGKDTNGDGLGDTPFHVSGGINLDQYPLMFPQKPYDTTPPILQITRPKNGLYFQNIHLFPRMIRKSTIIYGQIMITVSARDPDTGISHVAFYLDNNPQPQYIDYTAPYQWTWRNPSIFFKPDHQITVVAYNGGGHYSVETISVRRFR